MFPVIYSTLASDALINQVFSNYEIGRNVNCQFWCRGLSDVYLVETSNELYVLRVSHHHWRTHSEIEFELEFLNFLHQCQLPVAYPIKTNKERLSFSIEAPEGTRYAALFKYAPGTVPLGDLNENQSRQLGKILAQIHQRALHFYCDRQRQPLTLEYLLDDSFVAIAPFLENYPEDRQYLQEAIEKIKSQLQSLPQDAPYWTVCWGDAHSGNAHFTEDNQITLFDFDQCGYGWRAFDLAKFLQVSLRTGLKKTIREAFMQSYQIYQPLTEIELKALQPLTQTAHIWMWAIHLNSSKLHYWCNLDRSYFHQRLEQLKRLTTPEWQLF